MVKLAKRFLIGVENCKLDTLAEYFSVEIENYHRALDDAMATFKIFNKLIDLMEEKGVEFVL